MKDYICSLYLKEGIIYRCFMYNPCRNEIVPVPLTKEEIEEWNI